MTVICFRINRHLTMNEMTVPAVITADTTYRVEGDSYEPVGNIHPVDDPNPISVMQGSLLERYRTIRPPAMT